ncbi:carbon-nitrogen hydrolase [Cryphonectria parasitica EP155]|uniref:Carbon-nitrogen hydrolase n=1 Tax=Cryphonectria parasitica (strain ATCC 38755 / EP155) TaxID=660469 RepID=A0A9P4YCP6_CRYP1|nr:carbon-nitrogen hydrolase [Cryphonectria parasitica EP155]KAF3770663.1 carbon-nitrogen hydrolase [Cryphonectria parasitica EP155]
MRIACLQFAPQVGDTDNNLNRADAVLAKASQDDLDSLDLMVLPELAFSGWNFQSPEDIAPYLEPSGSGISSLWARTVALKHNTSVLVGYPEKVDVSGHHQAHPEFYNSAILVNGDGETVANYRKTFLYRLDEAWADEGQGFFGGQISGLGNTAIGICTDINPYRLEAPWHAFEFAFHILEVRASLVIVTMAWITGDDCEHFTQFPGEPDMEALAYWAQRLEPVIRDESRDEIVIVFCNRTGIEGDAVYSGTSAVIGIHQGEVNVYGLLGRGVKDLLVVDTDDPPLAKLILRKENCHLNVPEHETNKHGGQSSAVDSVLLTPFPIDPDDRTPINAPVAESLEDKQSEYHQTSRAGESVTNTHTILARPSSPKSRNVSRVGRPRRRLSSADLAATALDWRDAAQQQEHRRLSVSPRPEFPKPRSASLSSRYPGMDDELLERALDFYLQSIALDARDELVASSENESLSKSTRNTSQGSMREDAVRPTSHQRCLSSGPAGRSASVDGTMRNPVEDVVVRLDHQKAHAKLWEEISRLVEEHVGPGESSEDLRGRRRSRGADMARVSSRTKDGSSPTLSSPARSRYGQVHSRSDVSRQARPESPSMSTSRRTSPTQTTPRVNVPIRSVKDPSLGPPADPDDEIVAEIIFRRPNCATGDNRSAPSRESSARVHDHGSTSPGKHSQQCLASDDESEKTPTIARPVTARQQDLTSLALQTSVHDLDDELQAPHLSTASLDTLSSYEASPVTPPPPGSFEPRTPKAMILGLDCPAAVHPPTINHVAMAWAGYPGPSLSERIADHSDERPRSALL